MMNKEILENNKLIAEFIGWTNVLDCKYSEFISHKDWVMAQYYSTDKHKKRTTHIKLFKYHESWDWLMPVIGKIEDLGYPTTISKWAEEQVNCCSIDGVVDFNSKSDNKLKVTYGAIIEFINWYNKNKK